MGLSSSVGSVLLVVPVTLFLMNFLGKNQAMDHVESETKSESEWEMSEQGAHEFEEKLTAPGLHSDLDKPRSENDLTSSLDDLPFASDDDELF
jgi:hypothetical protein